MTERHCSGWLRLAALAMCAGVLGCATARSRLAGTVDADAPTGARAGRSAARAVPRPAASSGGQRIGRAVSPVSFDAPPDDGEGESISIAAQPSVNEPAVGELLTFVPVPDEASSSFAPPSSAAAPNAQRGEGSPVDAASAVPAQRIDLATVMQLVDAQNPQVQYARERIQEALAKVDRAEALWLPSIRAGVNWNKHEGRIQDVAGKVIDTSRGSYFTGLGSDAVGAGSPRVPGLLAQFHLADAVFEPRIAQSAASARHFGSQAATNDALLDSSLLYLALLKAHQEQAISREAQWHTQQLADLTALYAKTGQGVAADDDRARAELAVRINDVQRANEEVQVASARLAEQLRLDPSLQFEPREPVAVPLEFQALSPALPELVAFGLTHRPEISENRSLAVEASERLLREQYSSLVPSVILAMSYGGLAGGFGSDFVNWGDRLDADIIAWWEIRNLGFGDKAARSEARSRLQQAQWKEITVLDRVAREVVEAQSQVESRRRQLSTAEDGIRSAEASFDRNLERIRNAQGLPIEVLQSIQALALARREYLRVVISYNEAQFRRQRALGWPSEPVGADPAT